MKKVIGIMKPWDFLKSNFPKEKFVFLSTACFKASYISEKQLYIEQDLKSVGYCSLNRILPVELLEDESEDLLANYLEFKKVRV